MSEALTPLLTPDPYAIPLEEYDMIRQDIFHHDHHVGFSNVCARRTLCICRNMRLRVNFGT